MYPTDEDRRQRISDCLRDLKTNGIQIRGAADPTLVDIVRRHLDYFQLMIGDDSSPQEVLSLLKNCPETADV